MEAIPLAKQKCYKWMCKPTTRWLEQRASGKVKIVKINHGSVVVGKAFTTWLRLAMH